MDGTPERRWAQIAGVGLIVVASLMVLRPFIVPVAWAAILAYASWPLYVRIEQLARRRTALSASAMTVVMVLVVVVPTVLVSLALVVEVQNAFAGFKSWLAGGGPQALVAKLREVPWIGPRLAAWIDGLVANPSVVEQWVLARTGVVAAVVASTAGDLGRMLLDASLALLTLFFFYRSGGGLALQIHRAARRLAGERVDAVQRTLGETVRAVMYGTLATSLTQALLVGLSAWAAGLGSPVLLGALTGILSLMPAGGAPIVYVPAAAWLMLQGRLVAGLLVLAWGIFVVSSVDNVIRSWFLRGGARIPFLLAFFGVLGGLLAFGPIGLFVGPVTIALLLTLWREWTDADTSTELPA